MGLNKCSSVGSSKNVSLMKPVLAYRSNLEKPGAGPFRLRDSRMPCGVGEVGGMASLLACT